MTIFMVSFSYLNPFLEKIFKPYERYQRMVVQLTLLYVCFLLFLLHHVGYYLNLNQLRDPTQEENSGVS